MIKNFLIKNSTSHFELNSVSFCPNNLFGDGTLLKSGRWGKLNNFGKFDYKVYFSNIEFFFRLFIIKILILLNQNTKRSYQIWKICQKKFPAPPRVRYAFQKKMKLCVSSFSKVKLSWRMQLNSYNLFWNLNFIINFAKRLSFPHLPVDISPCLRTVLKKPNKLLVYFIFNSFLLFTEAIWNLRT